jgi:UDP-N-acetylglucosamine/UDP-N-acetylgalactosamine diphosphorylase
VFEVDRREEFSPLKNGPGSKEDNPMTSRRDVLLQGRRWIEAAGGVVLDGGDKDTGIEISPLVYYPQRNLLMEGFLCGRRIGVY